MKKILIIADGIVAQSFLERIINTASSDYKYYVIHYNENTIPKMKKPENFRFFRFDPTSYAKLSTILKNENFYQAMIIMASKTDTKVTYENIRFDHEDLEIVILDRWNLTFEDHNLQTLNANDILSNRFMDYLPDIPITAQNVGLGIGEIMEFKVPFGSPYTYRHLRNIEQKKWKIAAIYRKHELLLPEDRLMIKPNDVLLVVGEPNVLRSVYKSIKREFGQFPIPFGSNIYCYLDMAKMSDQEIEKLTNDSMLLHSKLNSSKLTIRVVNPKLSKLFEKIKSYRSSNINIEFEYYEKSFEEIVKSDSVKFDVGLFITDNSYFKSKLNLFYDIRIPILKVGDMGFSKIEEIVIFTNESEKLENISPIIFDVASQLKLDISLFDFDVENSSKNVKIVEHFENLSKMFQQKVKIIKTQKNPIRELSKKDNFLQVVLFSKQTLEPKVLSVFSTDIEKLHFKLSSNYQIFIPTESL